MWSGQRPVWKVQNENWDAVGASFDLTFCRAVAKNCPMSRPPQQPE
jgi:hypothetical protein